jgi:predicted 3-demethylubiquinone-9 3-methyltransferase (glyoxalase superfamily)
LLTCTRFLKCFGISWQIVRRTLALAGSARECRRVLTQNVSTLLAMTY